MSTALEPSITADGDTHSADCSEDIWWSREKEGVDLVVFESGNESGNKRGDSGSARFGDDNHPVTMSGVTQLWKEEVSYARSQTL